MDKLECYRASVETLLEKQSKARFRDEKIENALFFDSFRDRYLLMRVGWKGLERIYYPVLHLDIKDGQIWLQHNATELDVGKELIAMGVAREDIILGLHPAYKRPYTGYGVEAVC